MTEEESKRLVERLRIVAGPVRMGNGCLGDLLAQAADAIEAIAAKEAGLRASFGTEIQQMSEAFRAVNIGRVIKSMGTDFVKLAEEVARLREEREETKRVQAENQRLARQLTFWKDTADGNFEWAARERNRAIEAEKRLTERLEERGTQDGSRE